MLLFDKGVHEITVLYESYTIKYRHLTFGWMNYDSQYIFSSDAAGSRGRAECLDRFNDETMSSDSCQGMDIWPRLSVLCCPVEVEALRRTDPPSKESYQIPKWLKNVKVILSQNRSKHLIRTTYN
jgi:pyrroloquinoline quinone (PQQ) biosynthesis protein C